MAMTEAEGRAVLRRVFQAHGYSVQEEFEFAVGPTTISLDGYDPAERLGYEFITSEDGDREEITDDVLDGLDAMMAGGECFIFIVDEQQVDDATALAEMAEQFLAEVKRHR